MPFYTGAGVLIFIQILSPYSMQCKTFRPIRPESKSPLPTYHIWRRRKFVLLTVGITSSDTDSFLEGMHRVSEFKIRDAEIPAYAGMYYFLNDTQTKEMIATLLFVVGQEF